MKVLHVFKDYFPPTYGGIEQHINDVVHSLDGIQFSVLTSSRSSELVTDEDDGVRVIRAPEYLRPVSTPITPKWSKLLRESGADLFHFHMPNPFGEITFLMSRSSAPFIASYHADIIGRKALLPAFRPFLKRFLDRAQKIIVGSRNLMNTAEPLQGREEKCVVIPYGVDVNRYVTRPVKADEIRNDFGSPIVLFVGRLAYYKGLEVLVESMKNLDAICLIVGSGPKERELRDLITETKLDNRVFMIGDIDESVKPAYLHAADVFVLPSTSRAESFGISMLEAMACGVPAISTELGTGTSWVNKHRSTGLVVEAGDPLALAGAISALLTDDARRARYASAAAERAREYFSKEKMLESLRELYLSVSK